MVHDRFVIVTGYGRDSHIYETECTLAGAVRVAAAVEAYQMEHYGDDDPYFVFDFMAHRGRVNGWNSKGEAISCRTRRLVLPAGPYECRRCEGEFPATALFVLDFSFLCERCLREERWASYRFRTLKTLMNEVA